MGAESARSKPAGSWVSSRCSNRAPRNATVVAETPLEIAILQHAQFFALLEQSPSISHKLLKNLAARVQELDTRTPS